MRISLVNLSHAFLADANRKNAARIISQFEWYNKWQRVVHGVTASGTTSDNEW